MQKQLAQRSAEPFFTIVVTLGLLSVLAGPFLAVLPFGTFGAAFWMHIILAGVLAVAGYVFLWYALRSTDLSVLGPINAYKAVLGLVLGIVLLGELPTVFGVIGVTLIVAGSYFIVDRVPGQAQRNAFRQFIRAPGVQLRFAALICAAVESIFLKRALLLSSPIAAFLLWIVVCFAIAGIGTFLVRRDVRADVLGLRSDWRIYLGLAFTTGLMQGTTLVAFGALQVGYALALFQLSTLVTVYLGHRYFGEGHIRRRLVGSLIMVTGAVLIVTLGR